MNTVIWLANGQPTPTHFQSACQMVAERPRRARVFEKWGIGYCCGHQPLDEVCAAKDIRLADVLSELNWSDTQEKGSDQSRDWSQNSLREHVLHIQETHHGFLRQELPRLLRLLERVADDHGATFNELWEMQGLFAEFQERVLAHMEREEESLFPLLERLESQDIAAPSDSICLLHALCSHQLEHAEVRLALDKIRQWAGAFTPPQAVCNTYRVLLEGLAELDSRLNHHMSEEEDILFPRALAMEARWATT